MFGSGSSHAKKSLARRLWRRLPSRGHGLQAELDAQLYIQEILISLGQDLQDAHDPAAIGRLLTRHLVEHFDYEKAVLCLFDRSSNRMTLAGLDGYDEAEDPEPIRAEFYSCVGLLPDSRTSAVIVRHEPAEPVLGVEDRAFLVFRLREDSVLGILFFGNSRARAPYQRPVAEKDQVWWEILLRMGASALETVLLGEQLKAANDRLEETVRERTSTLAESREEYRLLYYESTRINENYRSLLDSTADPIVIHDNKGMPTYLNPAFTLAFGWNLKDFGVRTFRFIPPDKEHEFEQILDSVAQGETVANLETTRLTRDGRIRIVNISTSPYFNAKFDYAGCIFQFRDITDSKIMEKEYVKIQKLESLGLLAGGIAHDFNNILGGILMNAQMARLHLETGRDASSYLGAIEEATHKGSRLTQQFLTFARGGNPDKRFTSIESLLKDSVEFILHGSSVACEFEIEAGLWGVEIDEGQISQVLQNLVMNAKEAMADGGVVRIGLRNLTLDQPPEGIHRSAFHPGNFVAITLSDTGVGIPPEHLGTIFDPYFTTKPRSNGLGLATAHSIMNRHHGFLTVHSVEGQGSTFCLYLPAAKAPAKAAALPPEAAGGSLQVLGGSALVMDDDDLIRELTSEMLTRLGYRVEPVRDGQAALAAYRAACQAGHPFDLVIMDLTIPGGMGGRETIAELRKLDPDIRAIVSSGYSNDPILADCQAFGFQGVLKKPFRMEELKRMLLEIG